MIITIQGPPRSGTTTLVQKIISKMTIKLSGFYTAEVRKNNRRIGFDIIDIDTDEVIKFARKHLDNDLPSVGNYDIRVNKF